MYRVVKYRNILNLLPLFIPGILIVLVNYQIIFWGINRDLLSFAYLVWLLVGFLILICYLEIIFFLYSEMEITPESIIFSKPWRRFGLFRKRQSRWVIPHREWSELHAFRFKSHATLYFRKGRDAVFFATIDGGSVFVRKIRKHFSEKLIYSSNNTRFSRKLGQQLVTEFPERVMHY